MLNGRKPTVNRLEIGTPTQKLKGTGGLVSIVSLSYSCPLRDCENRWIDYSTSGYRLTARERFPNSRAAESREESRIGSGHKNVVKMEWK